MIDNQCREISIAHNVSQSKKTKGKMENERNNSRK